MDRSSLRAQRAEVHSAPSQRCGRSPLGSLLDAERDLLSDGRFFTFEMQNLLQFDDKAVIPVLLYLFGASV